MANSAKSAAVSHVGKIRSNNQDSGYAGRYLFMVADGMGGHAGGDVASAIAVRRIADADQFYGSPSDAEFALRTALIAANGQLAETVLEHGELTGMGTTVSGILLVDGHVAIAHIGDSRVYLLRDGKLKQITSDHTFVQRLVDSGRITPDEAAVHPRRSVLMRVLGDVDASPEIDSAVLESKPGDRWLICSDGLSSFVPDEKIRHVLTTTLSAQDAANRLVKESLDQGAPDNVTIVLVDIDESGDASQDTPITVGSAAAPLDLDAEAARRPLRIPSLLLHPLKSTQTDDSHFEPESDDYLDALMVEDRARARRRRIAWLVALILVIAAIVTALIAGYQYTQTRFYVGASDGRVAVYQGVHQTIGTISLSHLYESTTVDLDSLSPFSRERVTATIAVDSLAEAHRIVDQLANVQP
ncbi:MAG: serine/threonine-protein phosphatase [Salinibacterium sp.]|nr:MAG: serine/threonine-protein phosphatase [Salinibacterium sp.]